MKYVLLLSVILMSACSSTGQVATKSHIPQYCQTDETIQIKDGKTVSSNTIVQCSDNVVKKMLPPKMGLAESCREHWYEVNINGQMVERKGYACLVKGNSYETSRWYIVNSPY
jgi:hypothetical protein